MAFGWINFKQARNDGQVSEEWSEEMCKEFCKSIHEDEPSSDPRENSQICLSSWLEVNQVLLDIELNMTPHEWISNLQRVFKPLVKLVLLKHRVVVDWVCQIIAKHL